MFKSLMPFSNLALPEYREKTFVEWPYKEGKCTAKAMANAGFYVPSKCEGAVTCYFCFKELEGWEKNDDPFQEHKKHAATCLYINMFDQVPKSITFSQLLQLERARAKRLCELLKNKETEEVQKLVESTVKSSNNSTNTNKRNKRRK